MTLLTSRLRTVEHTALCVLTLLVATVPWSLARAKTVEERRDADPQGIVELVDLAGQVELIGWDRPEVQVSGTVDDDAERVDITGGGNRTYINVVQRSGRRGGDTHLVIHVPRQSSVSATLVSADVKLRGLGGDTKLQTVNGDISGDVDGDLRASTVSGSVNVRALGARRVEIKTISGDIQFIGGHSEVEMTTVSGTAKLTLAAVSRGRFKSVSGDLTAAFALAPDAQIDGESVSGELALEFPAPPAAEFDVQSLSGDIRSCFGPKPTESRYGRGSRLTFKNGDGRARVRIETQNGDVHLCAKDPHAALIPAAPATAVGSHTTLASAAPPAAPLLATLPPTTRTCAITRSIFFVL